MGYFQKTSDPAQGVPGIKFASDYSSLNAAFNDLQEGDVLFVNPHSSGWYTLTSTAEITQRNVQVIGMGGRIRPTSNGNPSPLIRIKNINASARQKILTNIVVSGLRLENEASPGSGSGFGFEVLDDYPTVSDGSVYHIKLENIYVENFDRGIRVANAYDVILDNCFVGNCLVGLRLEVTNTARTVGQVRLFADSVHSSLPQHCYNPLVQNAFIEKN